MFSELIKMEKRGRGRPRTDNVPVMVRVGQAELEDLDGWRACQTDHPTRPEAIRRLLRYALERQR